MATHVLGSFPKQFSFTACKLFLICFPILFCNCCSQHLTSVKYLRDHEMDKDTGTASRNHIKFPATPECTKTKELGNSKGRMTGKRRNNTDQSTKPIELSNKKCGAESEQADNVGAKSTSSEIVVEPHCAAKRLKDDPQIELGVPASQNGAETMKGHEKQFGISSCVASTETERRYLTMSLFTCFLYFCLQNIQIVLKFSICDFKKP